MVKSYVGVTLVTRFLLDCPLCHISCQQSYNERATGWTPDHPSSRPISCLPTKQARRLSFSANIYL